MLVPALSVAYLCKKPSFSRRELFLWLGMDLLAFLIPVLCVSRFQLIVAVVLALFVYMMPVSYTHLAGRILHPQAVRGSFLGDRDHNRAGCEYNVVAGGRFCA